MPTRMGLGSDMEPPQLMNPQSSNSPCASQKNAGHGAIRSRQGAAGAIGGSDMPGQSGFRTGIASAVGRLIVSKRGPRLDLYQLPRGIRNPVSGCTTPPRNAPGAMLPHRLSNPSGSARLFGTDSHSRNKSRS
jgi:hypothetical protein